MLVFVSHYHIDRFWTAEYKLFVNYTKNKADTNDQNCIFC